MAPLGLELAARDLAAVRRLPGARLLRSSKQRFAVLDAGPDALGVQLARLDLGQDGLGALEERLLHAVARLRARLQEDKVVFLGKSGTEEKVERAYVDGESHTSREKNKDVSRFCASPEAGFQIR